MINCLTFLVAASAMAAEPAAEAPAAFKDIRVHQTGGFAGFDIVYEIDAKGGWHRLSKRPAKDVVKGELGKKDLAKLAAGVKGIDWEKLPERMIDKNVADDFQYEVRVTIGKKKHTFLTDGVSAAKRPGVKAIIEAVNTIQRAR